MDVKKIKRRFLNAETLLGAPAIFTVGFVFAVFEEKAFLILGCCLMAYAVYLFWVDRFVQEEKKKELADD